MVGSLALYTPAQAGASRKSEFALPAQDSAGALGLKTFYLLLEVREGMRILRAGAEDFWSLGFLRYLLCYFCPENLRPKRDGGKVHSGPFVNS